MQGDLTKQGMLLFRTDVTCYRRQTRLLKKRCKPKQGKIFVFQECILVCEEEKTSPVLNYRISFQVRLVMDQVAKSRRVSNELHYQRIERSRVPTRVGFQQICVSFKKILCIAPIFEGLGKFSLK